MFPEPEYAPSPVNYARERVELYESSGGTEGLTRHGRPVVILTTTGAKSGTLRKTPVPRGALPRGHAAVCRLPGIDRAYDPRVRIEPGGLASRKD